MTEVRFTVPGIPRGKGRGRAAIIAGRARIYTPAQTRSEEGAVRLFAAQAMRGRLPMEGPVHLEIFASFPVPKSWSKQKRARALTGAVRPTGKPDCDNICKLCADSMNGVVWRDDSQVICVTVVKQYAEKAGVEIGAWTV